MDQRICYVSASTNLRYLLSGIIENKGKLRCTRSVTISGYRARFAVLISVIAHAFSYHISYQTDLRASVGKVSLDTSIIS